MCALRIERDAVEAIFEQHWDTLSKATGDENAYHLGKIGVHNVALAYLTDPGTKFSAASASSIRSSFPNIRLGLVVGICGGVPTIDGRDGASTDVLLGDVIISTKVVEYRHGTQHPDRFDEKNTAQNARKEIRTFLGQMDGDYSYHELQCDTTINLQALVQKDKWRYPGADRDRLYSPSHRHKHHEQGICGTCDECSGDEDSVCQDASSLSCERLGCYETVSRNRLKGPGESSAAVPAQIAESSAQVRDRDRDRELLIHFGPVASGDLVMKSGRHRDEIVSRHGAITGQKVIAFEMEGAGVWENLPTVVIKGVSDYSDSHKRDEWQRHAAATAAACTKAFLKKWVPTDRELLSYLIPPSDPSK